MWKNFFVCRPHPGATPLESKAQLNCVAPQNIDLALRVCREWVTYRFFPGLSVYKFVLPRLAHIYMPSLRNANAGFRQRPEDNLCHSDNCGSAWAPSAPSQVKLAWSQIQTFTLVLCFVVSPLDGGNRTACHCKD